MRELVQELAPAFTQPSFETQCLVLLGWLMCLGTHTQYRVFETIHVADEVRRYVVDLVAATVAVLAALAFRFGPLRSPGTTNMLRIASVGPDDDANM